jgi:hypothetical protein
MATAAKKVMISDELGAARLPLAARAMSHAIAAIGRPTYAATIT